MDLDDDYLPYNDWKSMPMQTPVQEDSANEYDLLKEGREMVTKQHWILSSIGIAFLTCFIYLLFCLIGLTTQPVLPNSLPITVDKTVFSEERARVYLKNITSGGEEISRVCFTEVCLLTGEY